MSRKEFYSMTERDYYNILIGRKSKQLEEARQERRLLWTLTCSYADPKKLPPNIYAFMPLDGDPVPKRISQEEITSAIEKFRNLGKKKK